MTTIGKLILALLAIGGTATAYNVVVKPKAGATKSAKSDKQKDTEDDIETIANAMRAFSVLPGGASEAEIQNWETQMKKIADPQVQKKSLCGLHATKAAMLAGVEYSARRMGDSEMVQDIQDDIDDLEPGSMDDWLFQLARRLTPGGSGENAMQRTIQAVNHECMQQPFPHVLHHYINRNSLEMRELEQCMANDSC